MKSGFFILISIFLSAVALCQKVAIDNQKCNIVFPFLENHFAIVVEGLPCSALFVKVNNGKVRGENCAFVYIPETVGQAVLSVYRVAGADTLLLEERNLIVKPWPTHTARIGNRTTGKMPLGELKAQKGLVIPLSGFDMSGNIPVTHFDMSIVRSGELLVALTNQGGAFGESAQAALGKIRSGDRVIFDNIYALMPGMRAEEKMNRIEIEVE